MAQSVTLIKGQFVELTVEGFDRNDVSAELFNVDAQSSDTNVAGLTGGRVEGNKTILTITSFNAGVTTVTITSQDKASGGQTFTDTVEITVEEDLAVRMAVTVGEPQDQ